MKREKTTASRHANQSNLTVQQLQPAYESLHSFFDNANLPEAKELLWKLFEVTVTASYHRKLNCDERCDLVYFYQQVQKLLDGAFRFYELYGKVK